MNDSTTIRDLTPMEEFLANYWDKFKRSHILERNLDLREYFQENPLTEESCKIIETFLKEHTRYDIFCAKYGIETKKLSYKEFAEANNIKEKRAKHLFASSPTLLKNDAIKLCYMAIRPEHLRSFIFNVQFELHNVMLAYDALTGKNTAYEHHVGVIDSPNRGKELCHFGYDTLEEIQKADRDFLTNDETGSRVAMANSISKVLNQYGLKNTLWRGSLGVVSGSAVDRSYPLIWAREDYDEVKIIFKPKMFSLDKDEVETTINSLVFANHCTGADTDRLAHGDLRVFFNPACHTVEDRRYVINKLDAAIRKPNPVATL